MEQVRRGCTVEFAAVNAVMAGCRPEYFPVVLAALEAVVDEGWPAAGGWQSTTGGGPLLIVNGPVREELGFNAGGNVFGPGFRANATVGRAIRLIIQNAYGIRPQELDQSTQGMPGKFTLCIGENEEESPWEPLHVELGHDRQVSTVSAVHTRGLDFVDNRNTGDPEQVLNDIADTAARLGTQGSIGNRRFKRVAVVFGPEHAQLLARHGFSKADVKDYLVQRAGRPAWMLRQTGRGDATNKVPGPRRTASGVVTPMVDDGSAADGDWITMLESADDVLVAVAGAANAGVTTVAHPLGFPPESPGCAVVRSA
jgi:hypothetical protein